MLRVLGTDYSQKTVYIIGGETRISTEVELMLGELSEYGVKVARIHGGNRYETSLNVAKQLNSNSKVAFVVGGDGELVIAAILGHEKVALRALGGFDKAVAFFHGGGSRHFHGYVLSLV